MDMKKLMKQMQQAQTAATRIQEELAAQTVEGHAGGSLVVVTMNGHSKVTSLKIKPEAIEDGDVEAIEDLILTALRDAGEKAEELQRDATKGLGIPGF